MDESPDTTPAPNTEESLPDNPAAVLENDPEALRRLADRYLEVNRPIEAAALYTRLMELRPDDPAPLQERAWAQIAAGLAEDARADVVQLVACFPDDANVAATAGELYAALDARAEALYAYDRAVALADDDPAILYRVARDYQTVGAPDPALALYDRLLDWRPREVLLARAELHMEQDRLPEARADLDRALAALPAGSDPAWDNLSAARVLLARARTFLALDDLPAAEADARAACDLIPDQPLAAQASATISTVRRRLGDLAGARAAAEQALAQNPDYLLGWLALSNTYTAEADWPAALTIIRRAQERFASDMNLTLSAALILGEQGDLAGAVREWDQLLEISPDNPSALAMRGTLQMQQGRPRAALADLDRALTLDPHNLTALQARASFLLRNNNLPAAITDLDRALAVEPHDTQLLLLRSGIHLELGNPLAAAAGFTRLLEHDPDNPVALSGLGNVQMLLGQYEGALRTYESALRVAPGSGAALYNLAAAQAALGRCPQAIDLLRRAVAADPSLAPSATSDDYLARCRHLPAFDAALRGTAPGPLPKPKGKKRKT